MFNFQGANRGSSQGCFYLTDVAVNQIIVLDATKVKHPVGFVNLFAGDADVVQRLSCGGVAKHLLEKQELPGVVAAHDHLVIGERLTQRVGSHPITKTEVFRHTLQHGIDGLLADGLVLVTSIIRGTAEHIVAQVDTRGILQIEGNCFHHGGVDGDVTVALMLPSVLGFLLQNGEAVTEGTVVIDEVGEPEGSQVTHSETKVDTNDEQHIVSKPLFLNEELGDTDDIIHTLDGLSGMLLGKLTVNLLSGGGDETSLELTAALLDGGDVDKVRGLTHGRELNDSAGRMELLSSSRNV